MWNQEKQIIQSQLTPNERLLWFGKPRQGFFLRASDAYVIPVSLMGGGLAIIFNTSLMTSDAPIFFRLLGIPFIISALYLMIGRFFVDVWLRSKTSYGVTNERIIIVSGLFNSNIRSLNLRTLTDITLEEKVDGSGTITFGAASFVSTENNSGIQFGSNKVEEAPNFEQIQQARQVYETIRNAQKQSI